MAKTKACGGSRVVMAEWERRAIITHALRGKTVKEIGRLIQRSDSAVRTVLVDACIKPRYAAMKPRTHWADAPWGTYPGEQTYTREINPWPSQSALADL